MRNRTIWAIAAGGSLVALAAGAVGLGLLFTLLLPRPPAFDRTGGFVLLYEVDVSTSQDADGVMERVIDAIVDRVDPRGDWGVVVRRHAENQVEIRLPVPPEVRLRRNTYLEARRALVDANINEHVLGKILDPFREEDLRNLKNANPDRVIEIEALVGASTAYEVVRGLDPADLMRLLRGAGTLEFRIAVRASDAYGVNPDALRRQLADRGPENTDSLVGRWFPINDLKQWYTGMEDLARLQADPVAYFASRQNLVAAERNGVYYLLLYLTPDKSMTHEGDSGWAVIRTYETVDNLGRKAVGFGLDGPGARRMNRLTGPNVGEPMAILLDGQVFSAPRINQAISENGIIQGNFTKRELDYLTNVLMTGSMEAKLSPDPVSLREVAAGVP